MRISSCSTARFFSSILPVLAALIAVAFGLQISKADCFSAPSGLVGWWPGDGNATNVLGTNNGSLQGGAIATNFGMVDRTFSFDGTNGYVQVPNSTLFQPTNLTIECWVRFSGLDSAGSGPAAGVQYLIFKQNSRATSFEGFDLGKTRVSGNDVFRFVVSSATGQSVSIHSTTLISTGVWYHVAAVRGSNFMQIYVNGVLERQTNVTFAQNYGSLPLYFGTSGQASWDRRFKGDLDEVALYDRALSSNEIAAVFAAGAAGKCKGPAACTPVPAEIAGWWPGEGNGLNLVAANPAILFNGASFATGKVGQAFSFDGVDDRVVVADEPLLNITNNQDFSIEAWIRAFPSFTDFGVMSIAGKRYSPDLFVAIGYELYLQDGRLACQISPSGEPMNGFVAEGPDLQDGKFHHVALTMNRQSSDGGKLYVDGEVVLTFDPTSMTGDLSNPEPLRIGNHPDLSLNCFFNGLIDEVAVYRRALTSTEVQSIYGAGAAGKCLPPLTLVQSPQSRTNLEDQTVVFSATVLGPSPNYQWFFNGAPLVNGGRITGATSNSLMIANVTMNDAGNYWLVATNFSGSVTSAVATLTVKPVICSPAASGLVAWWTADGQPFDSAGTNHGSFAGEVTYSTGRVGTAFSLDGDGDFISVGSPLALQLQDFSIEAWVRRSSDTQVSFGSYGIGIIFGFGENGYGLYLDPNGVPTLSKIGVNETKPSTSITDTNFHHLAVTKSGSTVIFYVDGVPYLAPAYDPGFSFSTVAAIGARGDTLDHSFLGSIDELAVYNRPLSAAEIASIYNAGSLGKCRPSLSFVQQPQGQTRLEQESVTFEGSAIGGLPLGYQWYFNGAALLDDARHVGAATRSLAILNLTTNDAGNYWAVASNASGVITSAVASLTVQSVVCAPASPGIVGWWKAEGNGLNMVSTGSAEFLNGATFAPGKIGQAFSFDGVDDRVEVPNEPLLNVKQNQDFSVEAWIKAFPSATSFGIMSIAGKRYSPSLAVAVGYELYLQDGKLTCQISPVGQGFFAFGAVGPNLQDGNFHHVALALSRHSSTGGKLFVDGQVVFTFDPTALTNDLSNSEPFRIGNHPDPGLSCFFKGLIDEVAVYGRALVPDEVRAIYETGFPGRCPLPPFFFQPLQNTGYPLGSDIVLNSAGGGSPLLTYQWYFNNVALTDNARVSGATNHTLIIANSQLVDVGDYFVVLTNPYGSATSTVAAVELGIPPTVVLQPTNQVAVAGGVAQFTAQAIGDAPLAYRWYQNTTALSDDTRHFGATTTNLVITNLVGGDAGNYTLVVTNPFGSATSSLATLSVYVPPTFTTQPRGYSVPIGLPVTLAGAASGAGPIRYQWLLNGNPVLNATNTSLTISNLALPHFGDYQLVATNIGGSVTSAVAKLTVGTVGIWGFYSQAASAPIWPAAGLSNVVSVAAGSAYSLALRQDGTVYAWGFNNPATNVPAGLSGVVAIAAGPSHALAVLSNGLVRAWGLGSSGQANVPATLSNVIAVAAGSAHSVALRSDGTIVAWGGSPVEGQTNIPPGLRKIVAIDAGGSQTLALREDGNLFGWGGRTQYPVPYDVRNVAGFSVGPAFSALNLALLSNGTVRAWGALGTATNVPAGLNNLIAVEAAGGGDQSTGVSLAVRSNRTVTSWGGSFSASSLTNIPAGLSNVWALAGGLSHAVALVDQGNPLIIRPPVGGTVYSGRDLVLKAKVIGNTPLHFQWFKDGDPIPGGTEESLVLPFAQAADAGGYYLIASNSLGVAQSVTVPVAIVDRAPVLMSQPQGRFAYYGSPFTVGASVIGSGPMELTWLQNGVATYFGTDDLVIDRALPQHGGSYQLVASNPFGSVTSSVATITFSRVAVWGNGPTLSNAPVDLGTVRDVAAAYYHVLAIKSNGTVAAWGTTLNGATNVPPNLDNVVAVTGGKYFSVALRSDGTAVAWGLNNMGQTSIPPSATNLIAIAAGGDHTLGLRADGTVAAWGSSANNATIVPLGLSNVVAISAGQWHSAALKSDGTTVTWGLNPLNPPSATNFVGVAAGFSQTFGLRPDGTVVTWMNGNQTVPTNLTEVVALASGGSSPQNFGHTFALKSDGTAIGWGNNFGAQLNFPPELTSIVKLSCGSTFTVALLNDRSPAVATQPFGRHVVSGSTITLAALSVGQPGLNFQWRQNGTDIPGATAPTLMLTNVNRNLRGYYSTLVWNALGSSTSQEAWLDVVGPVRLVPSATSGADDLASFIVGDSAGQSLTAGEAAWLETQASTNLINWQIIPGAFIYTSNTLLLRDPAQTNYPARFYRVIER
ncbi:MAG TPA: LamG-like jellyroll fold domain-containing protein [Verrucomicrobiae bacterium]|nr:LamG-like jellyroll fold domain-containing protein [Verrucomicrobiae bacterium]